MSSMKRKVMACVLTVLMVTVVFSTVPTVVSPDNTMILDPGWISGTLSVPGKTLDNGEVWAYSTTEGYQANDMEIIDGEYSLTTEGGHTYRLFAKAEYSYVDEGNDYRSWTEVWLENRETDLEVDEEMTDFDFSISPGYVDATVTVTGGDPTEIRWFAIHGKVRGYYWPYYTHKRELGSGVDGSTTFPVMPWTNYDATGDDDYDDWLEGDTSLYVYAMVWVRNIRYDLAAQYITVTEGDTTEVSWELDVSQANLYGSASVTGEDILRFDLKGTATVGETEMSYTRCFNSQTNYDVYLEPATWKVYPSYWFEDCDESGTRTAFQRLWMGDAADTVTLNPGGSVEHDFSMTPGYVTGSVSLSGAYENLNKVEVFAQDSDGVAPHYWNAYTTSYSEDYKLILYPGNWHMGVPDIFVYFDHDTTTSDIDYDYSYLRYRNYDQWFYGTPLTVGAGDAYTQDFSFKTAMVTLNYQISGGGQLYAPVIQSYGEEVFNDKEHGFAGLLGYARGSDEWVTTGEATIVLQEGKHELFASAYVEDGSYTRFGSFWIEVEEGDVIEADIDAPIVTLTEPGGLEHFSGPSVTVKGTATDDTEVETVTVNGVDMDLTETTPGDPSDVSFETTLTGLSHGENIITVVATDPSGKSTTVERTIFRDDYSPTIDEFSISPSDLVKLGDEVYLTAKVSDPDGDALTTTIHWGDGTTTETTATSITDLPHEYLSTGVYAIKLEVTDGVNTVDATYRYVVVYDPDGGFVTGGGWIDSPEGAYAADSTLTGRANFGFVSKYKKGADVPTGNVEFQFKVGDLNFHSSDFDWLVVAGTKAKFKGTGTINGEGSYGFMISAIDGDEDTFRIKIWDKNADDAVVYDNQMGGDEDDDPTTTLGGGNIVVHKAS